MVRFSLCLICWGNVWLLPLRITLISSLQALIYFFPEKLLLLLVKAMYIGQYTTHILHANLHGEKGKQHAQRKQHKYS